MVIGKSVPKERGVVDRPANKRKNLIAVNRDSLRSTSTEADDVIDLGAPRRYRLSGYRGTDHSKQTSPPVRASPLYTPNPRLYPRPAVNNKKQLKTRANEGQRKRRGRKRKFTKPVPNSRLYRPAPARLPPVLPQPRGNWPPPAPVGKSLATASKAALRLLQDRHLRAPSPLPLRNSFPLLPTPSATVANAVKARRLVVTLPAAESAAAPPPRYQPTSEHFRLRVIPSLGSGASTPPAARPRSHPVTTRARTMTAANKHSTSPDCSDGNEGSSAPSEFLAEFLSAIMRRQYAEALKYCQLILQYEPHNATARGFHPLLQHKVNAHANEHRKAQKKEETSSESEDTSPRRSGLSEARLQKKTAELDAETEGSAEGSGSGEEEMEQGADGSGSACSSLELDSEPSPASPSPRTPRRSDRDTSDPADCTDPTDPSDSASWRWESGGERSDRDDNGNHTAQANNHTTHYQGGVDDTDVENDNALLPTHSHLKSESVSSLQRLRAQFTCSIK